MSLLELTSSNNGLKIILNGGNSPFLEDCFMNYPTSAFLFYQNLKSVETVPIDMYVFYIKNIARCRFCF